MTMTMECPVRERLNVGAAALNREAFARHGVFAVSLFGGPSCGKTSLLEATLRRLGDEPRVGVIVGNIRAQQDAERLGKWSPRVSWIEAIDLTAELVREALGRIDLSQLDLLLIERAGVNASVGRGCEDLGQAAKVGIFSVSGGDDKVARYPQRVEHSDLLLLTKMDLLPYIPFEQEKFRNDIRRLNRTAPLIEVSVVNGQGLDAWCQWLCSNVRHPGRSKSPDCLCEVSENYFG